jgi:putative endonuclease
VKGNLDCGRIGETIAAAYLNLIGYGIIERNLRIGRNEIDIVAVDGECLVFVEVKTRRSCRFGSAAEAVGKKKLLGIRRAAGRYLNRPGDRRKFTEIRIDVVAVEIDRPRDRMTLDHLRGVS